MNLKAELDKLATAILRKAGLDDTPLTDAIDAFKATTAYYALSLKRKTGEEPDTEDENSFAGFQERLKEVENGGEAVGSNRRRRHTRIPARDNTPDSLS